MPDRPDVDALLARAESELVAEIERGKQKLAEIDQEREKWVDSLQKSDEALAKIRTARGMQHQRLRFVPSRPNIGGMDLGRNHERALKIAKTRSARTKRDPAYQAILDAGMTPEQAADVCGTTRDVLKQCWGKGKQFREIRPDWKRKLAKKGVPETVWRTKN